MTVQQTSTDAAKPAHRLKTGAEFKASLDDGRQIWIGGKKLDKVRDEPALAAGVDLIAEMFDDQFKPEFEEATTYLDPKTGEVVSRAWQLPTTVEELADRRKMIEYTSLKTAGTFGRPPDLSPAIVAGLMAYQDVFKEKKSMIDGCEPDFAENIEAYMDFGRNTNLTASESLAGPQTDRSNPKAAEMAFLRVKKATKDGIYVSGAKTVGSIAAQANDIFFTNLGGLTTTPPEACVWGAVPINADGIRMISREMVSQPGADKFDHPVSSMGEEADQFIVFDNVFVPKERIFNLGDPDGMSWYGRATVFAHWHVLTRMAVKAELFVGAGQLVLDVLGTGKIPAVQQMLGELIQYAQTLRAFVVAAEAQPQQLSSGVVTPDVSMLTAGRLYSIETLSAHHSHAAGNVWSRSCDALRQSCFREPGYRSLSERPFAGPRCERDAERAADELHLGYDQRFSGRSCRSVRERELFAGSAPACTSLRRSEARSLRGSGQDHLRHRLVTPSNP